MAMAEDDREREREEFSRFMAEMRARQDAHDAKLDTIAAAVTERAPAQPAPPLPAVLPGITLVDVWPYYERAEASSLKSWNKNEQRWRCHVSQPFGPADRSRCLAQIPCMAITLELVDAYRAARLEEFYGSEHHRKRYTMASVNRDIALLRRMLNFAVERKLIPYNPLAGVKQAQLIKPENNVRQTVIEEFHPEATVRLTDLLAQANPMMRAAILMSHGSGLRREEMSLATWERLDLRTGVLFIPDEDTKGSNSGREVILTPEALQAIAELPRDFRRRGGPILFNPSTGKPYPPDYFTKQFADICRRLGLPPGTAWFHDNRRSFVTLARRRGEDTSQIRQLTGHKTDAVFKRYNIFSRKDLLSAKKRMREAREQERAEFEQLANETSNERRPAARAGNDAPHRQAQPESIVKKSD